MTVRPLKYQLHKATGQARVRIKGRDIYLGKYRSRKSEERYRHLIMTHLWAKFSLLSNVADWSQAEIGYTAGRNISLLLIAKRVIARGLNAWLWRELPADANTQVNGENHTTEQKNNYFNNN